MSTITNEVIAAVRATGGWGPKFALLPFDQNHIDAIRGSVIEAGVRTRVERSRLIMAIEDVPDQHLWWPKPELGFYELRRGPAPENYARPSHLRDKKLSVSLRPILEAIGSGRLDTFKLATKDTAHAVRLLLRFVDGEDSAWLTIAN